jgi:Indigoidine synthase A like protein
MPRPIGPDVLHTLKNASEIVPVFFVQQFLDPAAAACVSRLEQAMLRHVLRRQLPQHVRCFSKRSSQRSLLHIHDEVRAAIAENRPVVALESTIISHGMPYPANLHTARDVEGIIRAGG